MIFRSSIGWALAGLIVITRAFAVESIDHPEPDDFTALVQTRIMEAQQRFQSAREQGELNGRDYAELAMTYDANDLPRAAAQAYRNAIELSPHDARWPYFLAQIAYKQGRFEDAVQLYRKSLALNPDYVPAHIRLAITLIEQSELQAARTLLEPVVESHPQIAVARAELGRALLQMGEYEAALAHLQAAHQLQPAATRLHYQIGTALRALGQVEEAREWLSTAGDAELSFADPLNQAMRRRSGSVNYWHNLAQRTLATGDTATAMNHLRTAMAADPDSIYPQLTMAITLAQTGRADQALELMGAYRARKPDEPLAALILGMILASEARDSEALPMFEAAHAADSDMFEPLVLAGHAAMRLERYAEAESWYRKALAITPNDLSLSLHRSAAQVLKGDCRQGLDTLVLMIPLAPEDADLLRSYARVAATCAEASEEERGNALNASRNLYRLHPDAYTIDTLAVVEAARGNAQIAEDLLAEAIFHALREQETALLDSLKRRLDQARAGDLTSSPWPQGHPLIQPAPPSMAASNLVQTGHRQ